MWLQTRSNLVHLWFLTGKLRLMTVCTENLRKTLKTLPTQGKHTLSYRPLSIIDFRLSEEWLDAFIHTQAYTYTQIKNKIDLYFQRDQRNVSAAISAYYCLQRTLVWVPALILGDSVTHA